MSPLEEKLRERIAASGPCPFEEFMDAALYDPAHGYYRRREDPFGRSGDYYTAAQLQPVFGILMREAIHQFRQRMGAGDFSVVDLGAGRAEMEPFLATFGYRAIDIGDGVMPLGFRGVVFANEFFDALPVHAVEIASDGPRERRVDFQNGRFVWAKGERPPKEVCDYVSRYFSELPEGWLFEVNLRALRAIDSIAASLDDGFVLILDYGFTNRELVRFPEGSLMSYARHRADPDVLLAPGTRDITAHVAFTPLMAYAEAAGFRVERFCSLTRFLLDIGETRDFIDVFACPEAEAARRRGQLKSLLVEMGETFRVLVLRRAGG